MALVLSRFVGQSIIIGDSEIKITVNDIRRQKGQLSVRLGIEAPREIRIWREEIFDEIEAAKTCGQERGGTETLPESRHDGD